MDIYEPAEDSYLLQKWVRKLAVGRVLDMGAGSGIQALTAIENPGVREVVAADIDSTAVQNLQESIKTKNLRKIKAVHSDLFDAVDAKFDLIIFNPPYLPQDDGIEDGALYGGKQGWELSEEFFQSVSQYLMPDGVILFLFSSLTNKDKIDMIIQQRLFDFDTLEQEKHAFEMLYVYKIRKTSLLRELEGKNIQNISYLDQGKRGVIYTGMLDKSKFIKTHFAAQETVNVAIKVKNPESNAVGRIENESAFMRLLNKYGIGPRYLFSNDTYLVYEFVEGVFISDWIKGHDKQEILVVLRDLLQQCFILDSLKINKEEMHHPFKHIIITPENRAAMLDFERCHRTENPHNVNQFVEFICRMEEELQQKGLIIDVKTLRSIAKEYKDTYEKALLSDIVESLSS